MKVRLLFIALLFCHALLLAPFSGYLSQRPVSVKLGYIPHPQILKMSVADHSLAVAEMAVVKVLFYFGTVVEEFQKNLAVRPEYQNMYRTLATAAKLDPYNMDLYYFAQAAFTWELGRIAEVNALLDEGMKWRHWDPWLPFYVGFNHAYFLKNYTEAARYMRIAAERSGNPLFTNLAARYFYESKQTDLGLIFLQSMIDQATDKGVKKTYQIRLDALLAIRKLEEAIEGYQLRFGKNPTTVTDIVSSGLLEAVPVDPYGGEFYLDEQLRVRSTSKLASAGM